MFEIGSTFRQQLANDNRSYAIQLNFTFPDASTLTVNNDAIWEGGFKIEDAVSSDNEFQIGSAIVNKLSVTLNNIYDDFSEYDFDGAVVVAYIGIIRNGSASELFRRGTYIVQNSDGYNTSLIRLECYDYMSKFDKDYALVNTNYPATLRTIVQNICTSCGVVLQNTSFNNWNYTVAKRPDSEGLTCRQMLAFVAQIACSFARCDEYGRLDFGWYDMASTPAHSFTGIYNISTGLDAILITGVRVTEEFAENEQNHRNSILYGNEGYVLEISGNDLIQQGDAQTVAEAIGRRVVNAIPFYKVNATILSDPSVEVGDVATITDNKGNTVMFPITSVAFSTDDSMTVACGAQDAVRHSATQYSELTRILVKAKQISAAQISAYDLAIQQLTELMSESFGIFKTEEVQQDGSIIYILHSKPDIQDSAVQWKMTANGLAVSRDYGQTWVAGIDSSGNAVVNVLNAIGVDAGWIRTGSIEIGDAFQADLDTGTVVISGDNVFIGDESATDALAHLSGALTITLSNESQGIPVDSNGDYGTFPNPSTEIRVLYGSQDVTMTCTFAPPATSNITGTLDDDGSVYIFTASGLSADTGYVVFSASYNTGTETLRQSKRFNLYKVYAGAPGPAGHGIPARTYFIEPNVVVLKQGQDKAYLPSTITFNAYYRDGNDVTYYPYTGLFRVETTTDGVTWVTEEYPIENKTYTTFTPTADNIAMVRCTLYSSAEIDVTYFGLASDSNLVDFIGDYDDAMLEAMEDRVIITGGDQIDIQTVSVVVDVSALTQEEVYNILTNNSELEGVYLSGGHLYINASMINTGAFQVTNPETHNETFYVNANTGVVRIVANSFSLSNGSTIDSIAQSKVDAQTQLSIYNKLTNNGQTQGIYLQNGKIYLNFTYAQGGTLKLGGPNNGNGVLQVLNSSGTQIGLINNAGASLTGNLVMQSLLNNQYRVQTSMGVIGSQNDSLTFLMRILDTIPGVAVQNRYIGFSFYAPTSTTTEPHNVFNTNCGLTIDSYSGDNTKGQEIYMGSGLFRITASNSPTALTIFETGIRSYASDDPHTYISGGGTVSNPLMLMLGGHPSSGTYDPDIVSIKKRTGGYFRTLIYGYGGMLAGDWDVSGQLTAGIKTREVKTEDYGKRTLYCYEMATPVFGDIGEGIISEDGLAYIQIDPIFSETINTSQYQVFLQAYGDGRCYVQERKGTYFIIAGTPGLAFGWEIKGKQFDLSELRLKESFGIVDQHETDYADMAGKHIQQIIDERIGVA